jgi:hypothetical protein
MSFQPIKTKVHKSLFDLKLSVPLNFYNLKKISSTQNLFGLFIDALVSRHIQFVLNDNIEFKDLTKLVLSHYLNSSLDYLTDKNKSTQCNKTNQVSDLLDNLDIKQKNQIKKMFMLSDAIFRSNILLDKTTNNLSHKLNTNFQKQLSESYLKFADGNFNSLEILYEIFIVCLSNPIFNERLAYQYVPNEIKCSNINDESYKVFYENILIYVGMLATSNADIQTQTELTNFHMKIIGYADIIIPNAQTIIDVKTSIFEHPKLEHLLQIIFQ